MDPDVTPELRAGAVTFGDDDAALLRAIDEHGSVSAAASALERSRARATGRLDDLEAAFGPLVERTRGGAGGGGTELTSGARRLLARFDRLRTALSGVAATEESVLEGRVLDRDGELATVETPVGELRALAPGEADRVQVSLRADAVTLHAPDEAPPAGGTSARNRLAGTVSAVERGESVAHVRVAVDGDDGPVALVALVTLESVDRLELATGRTVVATFKATATRATGLPDDAPRRS
ncbi:TOBE domain-containing protein [Haloglomus litoreum]|uniref:TOBE domain-containing protein n=1 Tax=Haloglomus litoreum TaxID=3034026 RepID=UPI0023E86B26|nr:TOBE domain-containing protein [Haloglomus sp. DT116]